MSDETEEIPVIEEEETEEEKPVKKDSPSGREKDPKRVKQGHKLAAIGQKAKEEKMRKKVKEEMVKPSSWVLLGVTLTTIGFVGLYFCPLFKSKEEKIPYKKVEVTPKEEKSYRNTNYFG